MKLNMKSGKSKPAHVTKVVRTLLAVGAAGGSVLLGGCILLSSSDGEQQCVTNADCSELASGNDAFAGTACVNSVCVSNVAPTTGSTSTGAGGGGGGGGDPSGCVSNQQCVDDNGGLPYMCIRPGEDCVSLISEDCQIVEGDFASDNAIVFGHMMSFTGGFKFTAPHHQAASNLAMKELDKVLAGLPGGPGGTRRPLVMVSCDEDRDPEEAARFLVDELDVKAIIGIINAENISTIASNVTVPEDVLVMGAGASPFIVNLDDQGLVFSVVSDLTESVNAYPTVISDLEAQIRDERGMAEEDPIKVALLVSERLDEQAKQSKLLGLENFTFNGMSWVDNEEVGNLVVFGYPDEAVDPDVDYSIPVAGMLEMEPDIIIAISGPELDQSIAIPVEENWPDGQPGPYWILPYQSPALLSIFAAPEERRLRARGVNYTQHNRERYEQWSVRFKGELQGTAPGPWVEARYDAVYALAYAYMATSGIAKPTGTDLAAGLLAVGNPPGLEIVTASEDIQDAANVLVAKGDIDLDGVYSNLNFNPQTGWVSTDAAVFCISSEGDWANTGQVYRTSEGVMEGEYSCP